MASSVDIVSALGHGLVASQVGPSAGYDAIDIRRAWSPGIQEGVIDAGSFEVTQRAAGANLSVDVAASTGDGAFVQGDAVTGQGLYRIAPHTAAINVDVTAANATNPRVDIVVLESKDDTHDVGGLNIARVRVIAGTATSGATLDNRTGAPALPSSCLLLADVHVPATDTTISNSQIRDRRMWARGAYCRILRTSGDYTVATTSPTEIDATNLKPRIECSGVPLRVRLLGTVASAAAGDNAIFRLLVDGATLEPARHQHSCSSAATGQAGPLFEWDFLPAAGSHTFSPTFNNSAGAGNTLTLSANGVTGLEFIIEEIVRQNTKNNATTSG